VPLAVVVDDRTDVWEPSALPQILTVVPHQFYKYEAYCRAVAHVPAVRELRTASIREIDRIRSALIRLRGSYYFTYDKVRTRCC
jgi:hypothetical protein